MILSEKSIETILKKIKNCETIINNSESNSIYLERELVKPTIFVGDLHGDIKSLEEIFKLYNPLNTDFIFLGDYIDKSPKRTPQGSIETLNMLVTYKIKYPENIFLLRGNHEFQEISFDETKLEENIWDKIENLNINLSLKKEFKYEIEEFFPRLSLVYSSSNILALHGGLPNFDLKTVKNTLKGEKYSKNNEVISQIVWNDNTSDIDYISKSERVDLLSDGFLYGEKFFCEKMEEFDKNLLLRGHDYNNKGFSFNNKLVTLFSCGQYRNVGIEKGKHLFYINPKRNKRKLISF